MDNTAGKWTPTTAEPSVFAVDATATLGYEPYMTKFRIRFGYILDDGTTELSSLFLGYLFDFSMRVTLKRIPGPDAAASGASAAAAAKKS
jgi:hypothetical protein